MKAGDLVQVFTHNEVIQGRLMSSEAHRVVIKLSSGYNLSFDKNKVKSIKVVEVFKENKKEPHHVKEKKDLKTVMILHTGGTIASEVSYETGGTIPKYTPEELLHKFPELASVVNVKSRLVRNMWSEDMNFKHYNLIAKEIV